MSNLKFLSQIITQKSKLKLFRNAFSSFDTFKFRIFRKPFLESVDIFLLITIPKYKRLVSIAHKNCNFGTFIAPATN